MNLLISTFWLSRRAFMESVRQPWLEIGNLFIPLFFLHLWFSTDRAKLFLTQKSCS